MRRKYSKISEGYSMKKSIKYNDVFNGLVYCIKFDSLTKPSVVDTEILKACIKNKDYIWFELFPYDDNYLMTIMLDDEHNVIQWYIDISRNVCIDTKIPYQDDLYLDIVITSDGKKHVLDIDELEIAYKKGYVNKDEYKLAYKELEKLERKYASNFDSLINFTKYICQLFNIDFKVNGRRVL